MSLVVELAVLLVELVVELAFLRFLKPKSRGPWPSTLQLGPPSSYGASSARYQPLQWPQRA